MDNERAYNIRRRLRRVFSPVVLIPAYIAGHLLFYTISSAVGNKELDKYKYCGVMIENTQSRTSISTIDYHYRTLFLFPWKKNAKLTVNQNDRGIVTTLEYSDRNGDGRLDKLRIGFQSYGRDYPGFERAQSSYEFYLEKILQKKEEDMELLRKQLENLPGVKNG